MSLHNYIAQSKCSCILLCTHSPSHLSLNSWHFPSTSREIHKERRLKVTIGCTLNFTVRRVPPWRVVLSKSTGTLGVDCLYWLNISLWVCRCVDWAFFFCRHLKTICSRQPVCVFVPLYLHTSRWSCGGKHAIHGRLLWLCIHTQKWLIYLFDLIMEVWPSVHFE